MFSPTILRDGPLMQLLLAVPQEDRLAVVTLVMLAITGLVVAVLAVLVAVMSRQGVLPPVPRSTYLAPGRDAA